MCVFFNCLLYPILYFLPSLKDSFSHCNYCYIDYAGYKIDIR